MVMLAVMTAVLVALKASDENAKGPQERTQSSSASSTLPGYPLDAASSRPVVPWLDAPPPDPAGPPPAVLPCQASQLRVVDVSAEGATGHAADFVEVENASSRPCSIEGRPLVELRDRRDRLVARSGKAGPFIPTGSGVNEVAGPLLVPAHSTRSRPARGVGERTMTPGLPFFSLAQGPCPGGVFPQDSQLFLVLPDGRGRVPVEDVDFPLPFDYRCDAAEGSYPPPGRPQLLVGNFDGIAVGDLADNPSVAVDLAAPPQVSAGSALRFRIRTRVSGDVYLAVVGCPGYTARLDGVAEERHVLNCAAIDDVPERRLLTDQWFEMVLRVPRTATPGPTTLRWQLDPPFQRARVSASMEVIRR
jgi:hypothetical protein